MLPQDYITTCIEAVPIIRKGWRWLVERNMEVIITPHYEDLPAYSISPPLPSKHIVGGVHALLNLQLINHRTDRPERIIGCWAELRKKRAKLWKQTLSVIPVEVIGSAILGNEVPIRDLLLPAMSSPQNYVIRILGNLKGFEMPRESELVLVFRMVGPMRRYVRILTKVQHDPKQADYISGLAKQ